MKITEAIDAINESQLESITINDQTKSTDLIAVIGLAAPVLIMVLELWKKIPGKKRATRIVKLDKIIAALRMAAFISEIKFK